MMLSGDNVDPRGDYRLPSAPRDYAMSRRDPRSTGESAVNGARDARHRRTRAATRKGFARAWRARSRSHPLTARETVLPGRSLHLDPTPAAALGPGDRALAQTSEVLL